MKEGEAEFFLKISENFSGPKQFVKLNPVDLKSPTLKYVFKSSQNMIILKLGDFKCVLLKTERNFCHPKSTGKVSGLLKNGPRSLFTAQAYLYSLWLLSCLGMNALHLPRQLLYD